MSEQANTEAREQREPGFRLLRAVLLLVVGLLLLVLLVLGSVSALLSTERGSRWVLDVGLGFVPEDTVQLRFDSVEGTFLRGLSLTQVQVDLGENRIAADAVQGQWNPFTLLSGEFILDALTVRGLVVDWQGDADAAPTVDEGPPGDLSATLDGLLPLPVNIRLSQFALEGARITLGDTELDITALRFQAMLQGRDLTLNNLHFDGLDAVVDGQIGVTLSENYALSTALQWRYSDLASGNADINGDLNALSLQHSLTEPLALETTGTLTLGVADLLNARMGNEDLPLAIDLTHTLSEPVLPFDGLEAYQFADTAITTRGWLDRMVVEGSTGVTTTVLPGPPLETALQWRAVYAGELITVESFDATTPSGSVMASGTVDINEPLRISLAVEINEDNPANYLDAFPEMLVVNGITVRAGIDLELAEAGPRGTVTVEQLAAVLNDYPLAGDGVVRFDGPLLEIDDLHLQSDDSELRFTGQFGDTLSGRLAVSAPTLENFYPPLSGALTADVTLDGTLDDLLIDIDAQASSLRYEDIVVERVDIQGETRSGNNQLLTARVAGIEVADQVIEAVTLRLEGQPDAHSISLDVRSELGAVALNAEGALDNGGWQGQLLDSEIQTEFGRLQQVQASNLLLSAERVLLERSCWLQGETSLCLHASLDEGDLLEASMEVAGFPLAVLNNNQAAAIVQAFEGQAGEYPSLNGGFNLPLELPPDLALLGELGVNAEASGQLSDMAGLSARFTVELSGLEAYVRSEPLLDDAANGNGADDWLIEQFLWEEAVLEGELTDGSWRADGRMAFYQQAVSGTGIGMRGSTTANLTMDPDNNLDGRITLDFDDLSWLEALSPQLQNVVGELDGAVNISGNLEAPAIGANINLRDTALDVPAIGLELRNVNVTLTSSDTETFNLSGRAESGSGHLELDADILEPLLDSRRMTLTLTGQNFNVANMTEATVDISPDLRVTASQSAIHATGTLNIPLLDARITELPETAVNVSTDAVLVRQRDEDMPVRNAALVDRGPLSDIPISAEVRVILGDEVRFSAFGLSARLAGMLDINQRPDSAPLAYGELDVVEGSFATYGVTLNIEQGQLLFFGPLDNPAIDIRAVRQVEQMRVGVQMNGTIRNIRSQLFSTPTLPDGDIIAVLITGRPMSEIGQNQQDSNALVGAITSLGIRQGAGLTDAVRGQLGLDTLAIDSSGDVHDSSITLGKYITPRIFIRYAVGLFETDNSLAIDYSVTDNIKLEAKSGQSQSVDITYTLER